MSEREPSLTAGPRNFRTFRIVLISVLAVLVVGIGYAVTLGPVHVAQWRAEVSDGTRALPLGERAQVTPAAGWVAEPLVRDLIVWPPLPPLKDWSVVIGREPGWLVRSPDQVLRVEVSLLESGDSDAFLGAGESGAEPAPDGDAAAEPARVEVLASGLDVTHVDGATGLTAVVDTGADAVGIRASVEGGGSLDAYRPALSELLESIRSD